MPLRLVAALAGLAMLVLASEASATVGGPCTVRIAGEDIGPREVGPLGDPIVVSSERPVSVIMTSEEPLERLKVEIEFAGIRWAVHDRPSTGTSWASDVPVDDYATYGLGLYKVIGSSNGADFTCEGAALIEVAGDDELSPLATPIGLAGLALAIIGAFGCLAIAVRVGQRRTSSIFGLFFGALFGLGVVVLLQQFSAVYPTIGVAGGLIAIGAAIGLALGVIGITGSQGDAR